MNKISIALLLMAGVVMASSCHKNLKESYWQGKIKRESLSIASKIPGRVVECRIAEGDFVQAGDTLLVLDIPEVDAKYQQTEGALLTAQSNYEMARTGATGEQLRQIEAKVMAAREQYQFAENSIKRMEPMFRDSMMSTQQYEESKMKAQAAKAQYEGALARQEEVIKGTRSEQIKMAYGQLQRAEGAMQEILIAKAEQYVIAPKSMEISSISVRVGELALAGYTLVSAYESGSVYFRFTLPENAIHTISPGSEVQVILPFDKREITGRVGAIRQLPRYADKTSVWPENTIGETSFELKIVPARHDDLSGMYHNTTVLMRR